MSILTISFPPSKNLEEYLKSFIDTKINSEYSQYSLVAPLDLQQEKKPEKATAVQINLIVLNCKKRLSKICKNGPKGRSLTAKEVEHELNAPFILGLFGESLEDVMKSENDKIPKVLVFLADAIIKLDGHKTEGI